MQVAVHGKPPLQIQKAYKQMYPEEDFDYNFFDETIAKFYETEQHTASLLTWATGLPF